jgi:hypothetical protein
MELEVERAREAFAWERGAAAERADMERLEREAAAAAAAHARKPEDGGA